MGDGVGPAIRSDGEGPGYAREWTARDDALCRGLAVLVGLGRSYRMLRADVSEPTPPSWLPLREDAWFSPLLGVEQRDGESHVVALEPVPHDAHLITFRTRPVVAAPTRWSVQVGDAAHVALPGNGFLEHSCDANSAIVFTDFAVVTRRAIAPGEAVTINYLATEWELGHPFQCHCESEWCVGLVRGFKHVSRPERERLDPFLSPYLRSCRGA